MSLLARATRIRVQRTLRLSMRVSGVAPCITSARSKKSKPKMVTPEMVTKYLITWIGKQLISCFWGDVGVRDPAAATLLYDRGTKSPRRARRLATAHRALLMAAHRRSVQSVMARVVKTPVRNLTTPSTLDVFYELRVIALSRV